MDKKIKVKPRNVSMSVDTLWKAKSMAADMHMQQKQFIDKAVLFYIEHIKEGKK